MFGTPVSPLDLPAITFGPYYNPPDAEYDRTPGGHANALGLTDQGSRAIKTMMRLGMIIDIDHMSELAINQTLQHAKDHDYPVVSGHTSFRELAWRSGETQNKVAAEMSLIDDQVKLIREVGGMLAPRMHQDPRDLPRSSPLAGRVPNHCAGSSKSWAQIYLYAIEKMDMKNVAIGTDINVLLEMAGPRFGPYAAWAIEDDEVRKPQRKAQVAAQENGVRYTEPTQFYRTERWASGTAYTDEEKDIWEAITLGLSRGDIDHADIRGNRPYIEVTALRSPGRVRWIQNIARGIRALRPDFLQDLKNVGLTHEDLASLFRSAEDYIRMWEKCERQKSHINS